MVRYRGTGRRCRKFVTTIASFSFDESYTFWQLLRIGADQFTMIANDWRQ